MIEITLKPEIVDYLYSTGHITYTSDGSRYLLQGNECIKELDKKFYLIKDSEKPKIVKLGEYTTLLTRLNKLYAESLEE